MRSQREIQRASQRVHVRARICAGPTWILFERRVAGRTLMPDEKQGARSVRGSFGVAQVDQYGDSGRGDANVVWFDVAVNDRRVLIVQEGHGVANGEKPAQDAFDRYGLIFQASRSNTVGEIAAIDIAEHDVVAASLVEGILEGW